MRISTLTIRVPTTPVGAPSRAGPARLPRVALRFGVIHVSFPAPPRSRLGGPAVTSSGTALWRLGAWSPARAVPVSQASGRAVRRLYAIGARRSRRLPTDRWRGAR